MESSSRSLLLPLPTRDAPISFINGSIVQPFNRTLTYSSVNFTQLCPKYRLHDGVVRKRQRSPLVYFSPFALPVSGPPKKLTSVMQITTPKTDNNNNKYKDDGTRVVPVPLFIHGTSEESVGGVYAVLDEVREMVYIGMSRDVAASLEALASRHDEVCYVKVMTFEISDLDQTELLRDMKVVIDMWTLDNETTPIGNLEEWYEVDEELSKKASALTPIRLSEDEEQELGQLQPLQDAIVSPFETNKLGIEDDYIMLKLTKENVDIVLEKVRPFLISDGGNISVLDVDEGEGIVKVQLEGACESCSSAAVTMQEGVEKILYQRFGASLKQVIAVDGNSKDLRIVMDEDDYENGVSIESCEYALESIRDVLSGLGADVSVTEIDGGDEVILSYKGPKNLKFGIEQTLRDKVSGVNVVTFE